MNFIFQQTFADDEFTGLHSLTTLNLQHNRIISIGTTLQKLNSLKVLNITYNDIKHIKADKLPNTLIDIYFTGEFLLLHSKIKGISKKIIIFYTSVL